MQSSCRLCTLSSLCHLCALMSSCHPCAIQRHCAIHAHWCHNVIHVHGHHCVIRTLCSHPVICAHCRHCVIRAHWCHRVIHVQYNDIVPSMHTDVIISSMCMVITVLSVHYAVILSSMNTVVIVVMFQVTDGAHRTPTIVPEHYSSSLSFHAGGGEEEGDCHIPDQLQKGPHAWKVGWVDVVGVRSCMRDRKWRRRRCCAVSLSPAQWVHTGDCCRLIRWR